MIKKLSVSLNYINEINISENELYTSYKARYLFNAKYLINLQKELNESGKDIIKKYTRKQITLF